MECLNNRSMPCDPDCNNVKCPAHLSAKHCDACGNLMSEIDYINHKGICQECFYERFIEDDENLLDFFTDNTDLLKEAIQKVPSLKVRLWTFASHKYERQGTK